MAKMINGIPVDHYDAEGHPIDAWGDRMDITGDQIQEFLSYEIRSMKRVGRQPIISAKPITNVTQSRQDGTKVKLS